MFTDHDSLPVPRGEEHVSVGGGVKLCCSLKNANGCIVLTVMV